MENLKKSDLQIAAVIATGSATKSFSMTHQMGLLKGEIPAAATADNVIVYDGNTYDVNATGEKWKRVPAECTSATWNASTTFTSSTNKPYHDTTNKILYYVAKTEDATISISATAGTQLYAWSVSGGSTTVSTKNVCKSFTIATPDYSNAFNQKIWKFSYSGNGKQWVAPHTGTYTMECWGANGGTPPNIGSNTIGIGGYVRGNISLPSSQSLFVFVGQVGNICNPNGTSTDGGWNGGGLSWHSTTCVTGGGGATDIRVNGNTNATWKNDAHLRTRIIVAAGGGGTGNSSSYYMYGGHGGGLIGYRGTTTASNYKDYSAYPNTGGTQTSGGKYSASNVPQTPGFGFAGKWDEAIHQGYDGGGGSGWYGGVKGFGQGGSGGSSFISGHPGCNAVNPSTGSHLGASTTMTIGGKEYRFVSGTTKMIDGSGKEWTTASQTTGGSNVGIPTKPSQSNNGNGYARITYTNP